MEIFEKKININTLPLNKVRRWISSKTEQILGKEDEIFIDYCINQLVYKIRKSAAEEELQISPNELIKNIEGFLGERAIEFVSELWEYISKFVGNPIKIKPSKNHNSPRNVIKKNTMCSSDIYNKDNNSLITKNSNNNEKIECCHIYKGNASYISTKNNIEDSLKFIPITSRNSKENRRARSLSRSLSPDLYESYGIKSYKYEKTQKMEEKSIIGGISRSKGYTNKSEKKSERLLNINEHITSIDKKAFFPDINPLNNCQNALTTLTSEKMEEYNLRMKALELFKRKNQAKSLRSESEEILRARAIEKFIKKKPKN
ncbi:PWI domain protein [Cryptosporidium meleagridis]|uniref:PWI domain protein n=1 Tax=Cryptosporidium meleagridis TaxID=93969 RepID=A0A2P4Z441_9CRYT|nr:PWI domain protein [Cryptosporidium meleagridis]